MMRAADQSAGMRLARWSAALIIIGVGAAAFRLSFSTLEDLATLARIPVGDAWLFPLIVDGTILLATFGVLVCAHHKDERRFFIGVLVVGSLVSVAGNSVHAVAAGHQLPGWTAALVAAVAPISLLVDTHGLALLFRVAARQRPQVDTEPAVEPKPTPAVADAVPAPAPVASPAPEPVPALTPVPALSAAPAVSTRSSHPVRPAQTMLPIAVPVGGA